MALNEKILEELSCIRKDLMLYSKAVDSGNLDASNMTRTIKKLEILVPNMEAYLNGAIENTAMSKKSSFHPIA